MKKMGQAAGQATLELAIFSSALILALSLMLRMGMGFNYSQRLSMQTFRKALIQAYENNNPQAGPFQPFRGTADYTTVEFKPSFDPYYPSHLEEAFDSKDPFGRNIKVPESASSSVVWSNNLFSDTTFGKLQELPKLYLEIAGKVYNFTLAGFKRLSEFENNRLYKKVEQPDIDGKRWKWMEVSLGELSGGDVVDVDADGKEETIIALELPDKPRVILGAMDSQEGEIDPEDFGSSSEFKTELEHKEGTYFQSQEDKLNITQTRRINRQEDFSFAVQLNKITDNIQQQANYYGDNLDKDKRILYVKTTSSKDKTITWITRKSF